MGKSSSLDSLLESVDSDSIDCLTKSYIERKSFVPDKIEIFYSKYSQLKDMPEYKLTADIEAQKLLPDIVDNKVQKLFVPKKDCKKTAEKFSHKFNIGVVFSGGAAPGGHNVIAGLYDEAKKYNYKSSIYGFLMGPDGILEAKYVKLTKTMIDEHRNVGGFCMINTGRTKIDSEDKMKIALKNCLDLELDALVVIGGDDSNTNAAFLAQRFKSSGIQVISVPKTIDGDMQARADDGEVLCAISFGFHTAARAFSHDISNLTKDAGSDVKYWHVCKVMGRVASHLALECAFQTHANITLIGEELADYVDEKRLEKARQRDEIDYTAFGMTLRHLSRLICDAILKRAARGKNFGVIIIPEGLIEFINEIQIFIVKLSTIIANFNKTHDKDFHYSFPSLADKLEYLRKLTIGLRDKSKITVWNARDDELFNQLPVFFQKGLLVERDKHGNFQFSQVPTEKIIMDMVEEYLDILKEQGFYKIGIKKEYYDGLMTESNIVPDVFARAIFENPGDEYLLFKESIISLKTLKNHLVQRGLIGSNDKLPKALIHIFEKSVPKFVAQTHFYGYDGRGSDPTLFDSNYTYNLGLTAFHLIAHRQTGQMAAIKNLEYGFDKWEPFGIPIARLMHLEERNAKLSLVIEKSLVDLNSNSFKTFKANREKWLGADYDGEKFRHPGPVRLSRKTEDNIPITLSLNAISSRTQEQK